MAEKRQITNTYIISTKFIVKLWPIGWLIFFCINYVEKPAPHSVSYGSFLYVLPYISYLGGCGKLFYFNKFYFMLTFLHGLFDWRSNKHYNKCWLDPMGGIRVNRLICATVPPIWGSVKWRIVPLQLCQRQLRRTTGVSYALENWSMCGNWPCRGSNPRPLGREAGAPTSSLTKVPI